MTLLKASIGLSAAALIGGGLFMYSGLYNIGADVPHFPPVFALLEILRDRSIAAHAKGLVVPHLDNPALIAEGAGHYREMCSGCHLAPGIKDSEIRAGLYPRPPAFTEPLDIDAAQTFWVIKHGVKLTAMPAWGATHDDQAIWGLVAFVRQLPTLSAEQYEHLTNNGEGREHHHHSANASSDGDDVHDVD